ncbi:MAG TPA: peptide deformylase [Candidatus Paceibacterota bacterium]
MPKKILQRDNPVLRKTSEEVELTQIKSPKIQKILEEMKSAMDSQDDGVAIAAPQIGHLLRIFIVSGKVKNIIDENKRTRSNLPEQNKDDKTSEPVAAKDIVFINPVIKKISKEKKAMEEGCLSVRYLYGKVFRNHKATVEAFDQHGKKFTMGGVGLLAQIFQHEIDHLDGVLFIDKAKDLEEIPPEETPNKQNAKRS